MTRTPKVKLTAAQREMLLFLAEHPIQRIYLNQNTLKAVSARGLVGLIPDPRPSPGTTRKLVSLSDAGRAALATGGKP